MYSRMRVCGIIGVKALQCEARVTVALEKTMLMSTPVLRRRFTGVVVLLALTFVLATSAVGDIRGTDVVGDVAVSSSGALKAVAPDLVTPSAVLETADGQVLWSRNADDRRAMASTTKIMTAIVVLEAVADLSEKVTVPREAATVGEADVGLRAGQNLSVRQLLEATLIHSGNDAATALAIHIGGSVDGFVRLMNDKAESLNLPNTQFTNAHGLDETGHRTSAADLATMARYAMGKPAFREMVGSETVSVSAGGTTKRFDATNLLIGSYDGATGVKTGWTNDAGYCLVASAERGDIELFAVILGTKNENARFVQAKRLLDWGFEHYAVQQVASAETTVALVAVTDFLDRTVPAVVAETTATAVFDVLGPVTSRSSVTLDVQAPVVKGQRLGTLTVEQGGRLIAQVPIVAATAIDAPDRWERFTIGITRFWRTVFGGQLQAEPVTVQ